MRCEDDAVRRLLPIPLSLVVQNHTSRNGYQDPIEPLYGTVPIAVSGPVLDAHDDQETVVTMRSTR